jgi:hypothetical protein
MRWGELYKWSGVLHMNIGAMTLFEFMAATRGYAEANGAKPKGGSISEERMQEMGIEGF